MKTHRICRSPAGTRGRQHGVTLIELMVGLVIGLLATLVMSQMAIVFEGNKRSTASGSDAQVNGALALSTLQRYIMASGFGLTIGGAAGCTIKGAYDSTPTPDRILAPVLITQGSSGAPDSIRILMSSNSQFSLPMRVAENHLRSNSEFVLDDRINVGNGVDDLVLAVPSTSSPVQVAPNWCSLFNISDAPSGNILRHDTDTPAHAHWNQDSTSTVFPGTLNADVSYAAGSYLINLGTLTDACFFVSGTSTSYQPCGLAADSTEANTPYALRSRRFNSTNGTTNKEELYSGVANLQAVYGLDTNADRSVDTWTTTTPSTPAGWAQLVAVRVAVVVRNDKYEQNTVTTAQPTWLWDGINAETLKIDHLPDWQHYRYRVFEAIVPLRNMIWRA